MASYERQTWVDLKTPLDAAHMNHIEEGIASIVGITSIKQTTTSTADGGNNVITATLDNGTTETFNIKNGSKGSAGGKGDTGAAGVGIKSVVQTTTSSADGGNNVITVTKTDGTTSTFVVKNGSKGSTGAAGAKGADGYTPVKGVDYFTPADQESIVQQVIAALGTPVFGRVDENNNIILTGELTDGTYTFKYEDAEGNVVDIGTLNQTHGPSYTNQIPISTNLSGAALTNGVLYADKRWNSSGGQTAATGYFVSGLIPVKVGDKVCIRWPGGGNSDNLQIKGFKANRSAYDGYLSFTLASNPSDGSGGPIAGSEGFQYSLADGIIDFTMTACNKWDASVAFITVTLYGAPADCIVTINEPIE